MLHRCHILLFKWLFTLTSLFDNPVDIVVTVERKCLRKADAVVAIQTDIQEAGFSKHLLCSDIQCRIGVLDARLDENTSSCNAHLRTVSALTNTCSLVTIIN